MNENWKILSIMLKFENITRLLHMMSEYEKSDGSRSKLFTSALDFSDNIRVITIQYMFKAVKKNKNGASKPAILYRTVPIIGPIESPIPLAVSAEAHTIYACFGEAIIHIEDIAVDAKLWPKPWISLKTTKQMIKVVEFVIFLSNVNPKNGMLIHIIPI